MEERDFFIESEAKHPATLNCPSCHQSESYELRWIVRKKKDTLPPRADADDRAKYMKLRSYMLRKDDKASCKNPRCRKNFDISGIQSVVFL